MSIFERNTSFSLISLPDLASAFLGDTDEKISMPGFQRNAVWNEVRVEDLWDSLFCHFPIGSILLARYGDFNKLGQRSIQLTRSQAYPDTLIGSDGNGYIVVDGQQRLNAISLGYLSFQERAAARLWIDLAGPSDPTKRQYDFYLCTKDNPFGRELSKDEKRQALTLIQKDGVDDSELTLDLTFPYKARLPVPFVEFCKWIKNNQKPEQLQTGIGLEQFNLTETVVKIIRNKFALQGVSQEFFSELIATISQVVFGSAYNIPLILIEKRSSWMTEEKLGKLFERVNINGQVPPQAELFFSALKLRMPEINNYVAEIYNDPTIGRLFKPTDIVLAALRIANPKIVALQLDRFDKVIQDHKTRLLELMDRQSSERSVFGNCLHLAYQLLHYNGIEGDIGLSRQFLYSLRPRVWQTILIWIERNLDQIDRSGVNQMDRLNIIRYAVIDSMNFFINWQRDLSNYVNNNWFVSFPAEFVSGKRDFPGIELYLELIDKIRDDGYSVTFRSPNSYLDWISENAVLGKLNSNQLSNEHYLVMYGQRKFLGKWEKYRLDIDHIIPSDWMYFKAGPIPLSRFWKVDGVEEWWRSNVINRWGNKRYWPDTLNRANQAVAPQKKYIISDLDVTTDNLHSMYGLNTVQNVLEASAIDLDLAEKWMNLSAPSPRVWTTKRLFDFREVVDLRRFRLYSQLFEALEFSDWVI